MAITWTLGPSPKWYFADLTGKPLGGGTMYTYSSLNPQTQKPVFMDAAGQFPWTDPILIAENGQQGPFFFQTDSSNLADAYNIEVYDAQGNLQWQFNNYLPGGGGGGGNVTEGISFTNLITNNVFWRNIAPPLSGGLPVPISISTPNVFLCPSAHSNFAMTSGTTPPGNQADIRFIKNNNNATDTFTFTPFPLGSNAFSPEDITPPVSLNYSCTAVGAGGETFKYVQFPISTDLQSTSNQTAVVTIWARCNSGANQLSLFWGQFLGDGGGSTVVGPNPHLIQTLSLTSTWTKYEIPTTIPTVAGLILGACQNTGLYLQVQYPLSQITSIDIALPSAYLNNFAPKIDYVTNDEIDAVINSPRTGDVRVSLNGFTPWGWVSCDDGTIGNPSSGATTRANFDTFPLFDVIWQNVSNTWAPIQDSAGNPSTRGATSFADYAANKRLSLTKVLGRALASQGQPSSGGTGNTWALGTAQGEENHTLTINEMPNHDHGTGGGNFVIDGQAGTIQLAGGGSNTTTHANTGTTGGGAGHNTIQPTSYFNVFLKL